ncbi:PspC domain-containing protein [Isoptericola sp. BMS4]|uniref:PspC domain-containing protein n=1 Tax=Isoptericola sp. BMS4 TaxID=2527875 RepID=UPI001421B714|nr:PspC domain-containing protein [Isoptericola sp. BMS4]
MTTTNPTARTFFRPSHGRVIGGVCAGIADYFGWNRTLVRVLTVASIFIPGPQVLAYVLFWIFMPSERKALGR